MTPVRPTKPKSTAAVVGFDHRWASASTFCTRVGRTAVIVGTDGMTVGVGRTVTVAGASAGPTASTSIHP